MLNIVSFRPVEAGGRDSSASGGIVHRSLGKAGSVSIMVNPAPWRRFHQITNPGHDQDGGKDGATDLGEQRRVQMRE